MLLGLVEVVGGQGEVSRLDSELLNTIGAASFHVGICILAMSRISSRAALGVCLVLLAFRRKRRAEVLSPWLMI